MHRFTLLAIISSLFFACEGPTNYDVLITNALIYDGTLTEAIKGSVAINGKKIVKLGDLQNAKATKTIDAGGNIVAPGFINMLSWATVSLLEDGRAMSDVKQGVTLEVMGEGWSMGPVNEKMREEQLKSQGDIKYDIPWTTLGEYLEHLVNKGVGVNVASFMGATTARIHELAYENRAPTDKEMDRMKALVKTAMEEGAMGIGASLIYAPAFYADTDELIELCKVAAEYDGMYITHMRSEGNKLLEGVDETLAIAKGAGIRSEIYHLKASGESNWHKMDQVIEKLNAERAAGTDIAVNMYNYVAGATGLDASMPPWVQEGGYDKWSERLQDPKIREKVIAEMKTDADDWENLYYSAGSAEKLLLVGFKNDELKKYTGKTLQEVADIMNLSPEEAAIELVIADGSRVGTVYFLMSEDNVKKQLKIPYLTFGSDAGAPASEGVFLKSSTHPRAYGNVARLLGKYVRDEKVIPMHEAIHKLTGLAADKLRIKERGYLKEGFYADVVVFDPKQVKDNATFQNPHQYADGMIHVFVNGTQVLEDGEHTDAMPGMVVRGPGYKG